jgi:preprotein translocase subunit SecF
VQVWQLVQLRVLVQAVQQAQVRQLVQLRVLVQAVQQAQVRQQVQLQGQVPPQEPQVQGFGQRRKLQILLPKTKFAL